MTVYRNFFIKNHHDGESGRYLIFMSGEDQPIQVNLEDERCATEWIDAYYANRMEADSDQDA